MNINIVFLDIDGPLCNHRAAHASGDGGIIRALDPVGVGLLNRVCAANDAGYVVTSSWRKEFPSSIDVILQVGGVRASFLGVTKTIGNRGTEIKEWLDRKGWPPNFAILDDSISEAEAVFPDNCVRVDPYDGIGWDAYVRLDHLLGGGLDLGPQRKTSTSP